MTSLRKLAVIVVALAANVDAFVPGKKFQRQSFLCSTMDKKDEEMKEELLPPPKVRSTGIKIAPISPLGASTQFGKANPLKEFPTYEMKERFKKIREPRKQFTKVPTKMDPPQNLSIAPKSCPPLLFGIGEFFDTESLVQTIRENADVGKPLESTRSLADKIPIDEETFLSCGSSSCTQGGWPSKIPAANKTQVFYLLSGFGCLTDMDGTRHYFGPGDTVVVPRNWAGRVDVAEDLHKIWFALDHETITEEEKDEKDDEEEGPMVRAKVIHYHELVKWSFKGTNDEGSVDDAHKSEKTFTTLDDFGMGLSCITAFSPATSTSVAPKFMVSPRTYIDCFHLLEGTMVLKPAGGPNEPSFEFTSGDTVVLPKGWHGTCEIKDPVKALRVKA